MAYDPAIDRLVRHDFPQPIATAWAQAQQGTGASGKIEQARAMLDIFAQMLAAMLVADYLLGSPGKGVEKTLSNFSKPGLGTRWQLVGELSDELASRATLRPYVAEVQEWWHKGWQGQRSGKVLTEELNRERVQEAHGMPDPGLRESSWAWWEERISELALSLEWLRHYALLRPGPSETDDAGWTKGEVICWRGQGWSRIETSWYGELRKGRIYLWRQNQRKALDASAWLRELPDYGLAVLESIQGRREPRWDVGGHIKPARAPNAFPGPSGEAPWNEIAARTGAFYAAIETGLLPNVRCSDVERFEVLDEVGRGAMGVVLKVHDRQLDGRVRALKVLRAELRRDTEAVARLQREAQLATDLNHPHIVAAQIGTYLGQIALSMEFAVNGTLENRMTTGARPEEEVRDAAVQLLDALAYAHSCGVVHRDVKPSNVLVYDAGSLKLADFGVAGIVGGSGLTQTGSVVGTPAYMAPEAGGSTAGDVWSLAQVLSELLAGKAGVAGHECDLPGGFGDLIRSMGAVDPSRRPSASAALARLREKHTLDRELRERKHSPRASAKVDRDDRAAEWVAALWAHLRGELALDSDTTARLAAAQAAPDRTALDALRRVEAVWRKVHWPGMIAHASVADLARIRGIRWWSLRLQKLAGENGGGTMDAWASVPARRLGLRALLTALLKRSSWINENDAVSVVARSLSVKLPPDGDIRDRWRAVLAAIPDPSYRRVVVPRKSGGRRHLDIPHPQLAAAQTALASLIQDAYRADPAVTGFVGRRAATLHAWHHAGAKVAYVADIRDFFGSVHPGHLKREFAERGGGRSTLFAGWSDAGANALTRLCFKKLTGPAWVLPQGGPSSPLLANLAAQALDARIVHACREAFKGLPWAYSRYADDLVLSLAIDPREYCTVDFESEAAKIVSGALDELHWRAAPEKTRVWRRAGAPLVLCGIAVPEEPTGFTSLPRESRRRVRAALKRLGATAEDSAQARGLLAWAWSCTGNLGYLAAISPRINAALGDLAVGLELDPTAFTAAWARFTPRGAGRGADH